MINLTVSHNIFLTKEERYLWFHGHTVEVIGVNTPIWSDNQNTSEPGKEIFCKYKLYNKKEKTYVKHLKNGYSITMAREPLYNPIKIDDKKWNQLNKEEQFNWLCNNEPDPCIHNILDIKDGGSEWIVFQQSQKSKKDNQYFKLIHNVEIKPLEILLESLC